MPRFDTLPDLLAANQRDDRQITLIEGENEQRLLGFRALRQRALATLGALQRRQVRAGDAMILFLADNERFLEMFWACVLGGVVPVPLAAGAADEPRRKLMRVFGQFERAWLATDADTLDRLDGFAAAQGFDAIWERARAHAVVPGTLAFDGEPGRPVSPAPDDLAFIQFSSGSTGEPKGVRLTHRNLGANIEAISAAGRFTERDTALSWMPLSHDMGLIGFHLHMLGAGIAHAIMRTDLFARRPLLWLEQAARRRATVLCSPNFGYQHYLRQYDLKRPQGLDLSAVRLIFNGAEPISAALCRRFSGTLEPHGLRPEAMFPVYGLAEASLAVSFPVPGAPLETVWLDRGSLRTGEPVRGVPPGSPGALELVQLGRAVPHCEIRIVDDRGVASADHVVGRIEIRGDNVSQGYHGDAAGAPGWRDTGDLGFFLGGELVVTGREKDLAIINGQNVYPHDIDRLAEGVPGIEPQRVAAAGVRLQEGDTEGLAVFVLHRAGLAEFAPVALAVRKAIAQQAGLEPAVVVPVSAIPKTTSGKIQRHVLARDYERGDFDAALRALAPLLAPAAAAAGGADGSVVGRLVALCAPLVPTVEITADTNLLEINLNSLTLARIHEAIEREFPQRIEITDFFDHPTLQQLAAVLESPAA